MTGIAGGIAKQGIKCGDVVIAESIQDYATGKIADGDTGYSVKVQHELHQLSADYNLLSQIREYVGKDEAVDKMNTKLRKSNLLLHDERCRVTAGPTVCGPFVMTSENVMKSLEEDNRKICAIDMEGFGLYMTSYLLKTPSILIKGISDMANAQKNDDYHKIAAFASAALLYGFLKDGLTI